MAMESEQVWKLFEQTGNIGVYMLYKQLEEDKKAGEDSDYADSDRGDCD